MLEECFVYVWRMMIDAGQRGHGYGAAAMRLVVERASAVGAVEAVDRVVLSHADLEGNAAPFYAQLSFAPTGEIDGGEVVMALSLLEPAGD